MMIFVSCVPWMLLQKNLVRREIEKFLNYQVSKTNPACSSFKEDSLKKKNLRENYSFCDL